MPDSGRLDASVSKLFMGGSVIFVGLVFELGVSFGAKLLIARYLGPIDYGAVSLGITTMSLAATLVLSGLYTGIGRYLPRYDTPAERRGILVSAFQMGVLYAVVVGLLIAAFAPWIAQNVFHDASIGPIIRLFGLVVPAMAVVRLSIGAVQGMKHTLPKVYIENFTIPLVRFGGIALVVVVGLGALHVAWVYLFSYSVAALGGVYYLWRRTSLFSWDVGYTPKHWELLAFSAPLVVSTAMSFTMAQLDTLLLGYFSATADVGIYNVVYPIAQLLTVFLASIGFIFMPVVSELHSVSATGDMRDLYQTVTKWLFSATLPLFLVVAIFPTMTIKITFGSEYLSGAAALSVLAVAFLVHALLGPNGTTLTAIGRTRLIMYVTAAAGLLNLGLNLVLIPRYSFLGAAVATAVSYALLNGLYAYQLYRLTGIHPFTRALVVPAVIGGVTVAAVFVVTTTLFAVTVPLLIVMFGVFVVLYGLAVLRFGIEEEEVRLVLRLEERYDVDLGPVKSVASRLME